jgi:tetraacyldisaccharide 4'-kinase
MRDPEFWWEDRPLAASLLRPVALVYGAVAAARMKKPGVRAKVPVICIGNFTLGGAGKTPVAIAVARLLVTMGEQPFFLTRGYGGALSGPVRVDPAKHRASEVGDEPLLLARTAPVIVAHNRAAGAAFAQAEGASVIVMDDGLQNPSLQKDLVIAVVDARRGIGNANVFPAGPLRAPLDAQLKLVDALLWIGEKPQRASPIIEKARAKKIPVLQAQMKLDANALKALGKKKVLAFAGIGDPEKFFSALSAADIEAAVEENFPDHHPYSADDAKRLLARCEERNLIPVTTEKDFVRLSGNPELAALAAKTRALPVSLEFQDERAIRDLIGKLPAKRP